MQKEVIWLYVGFKAYSKIELYLKELLSIKDEELETARSLFIASEGDTQSIEDEMMYDNSNDMAFSEHSYRDWDGDGEEAIGDKGKQYRKYRNAEFDGDIDQDQEYYKSEKAEEQAEPEEGDDGFFEKLSAFGYKPVKYKPENQEF